MENVSAEMNEYANDFDNTEKIQSVLNALADFHTIWMPSSRKGVLQDGDWLYSQKNRIDFFASNFRAWLDPASASEEYVRNWTSINSVAPGSEERAKIAFMKFVQILPKSVSKNWRTLMADRSAIHQGLDCFATTLVHGDISAGNVGIRVTDSDTEVVLIDWDRAGIGVPAIDVAELLFTTYLLPMAGISVCPPSDQVMTARLEHILDLIDDLQNQYFRRMCNSDSTGIGNDEWNKSFKLSLVMYAVSVLPIVAGYRLDDVEIKKNVVELASYFADLFREVVR